MPHHVCCNDCEFERMEDYAVVASIKRQEHAIETSHDVETAEVSA